MVLMVAFPLLFTMGFSESVFANSTLEGFCHFLPLEELSDVQKMITKYKLPYKNAAELVGKTTCGNRNTLEIKTYCINGLWVAVLSAGHLEGATGGLNVSKLFHLYETIEGKTGLAKCQKQQ